MKTYEVINVLDTSCDCGSNTNNSNPDLNSAVLDVVNTKLKATSADLKIRIDSVNSSLESEVSARKAADKDLEIALNNSNRQLESKISDVQYKVNSFNSSIADLNTRLAEESRIRQNFDDTTATTLKWLEDNIEDNKEVVAVIEKEEDLRKEADEKLESKINSAESTMETKYQNLITIVNQKTDKSEVLTEIHKALNNRNELIEEEFEAIIDSEVSRLDEADKALEEKIAKLAEGEDLKAEIEARQAADAELDNKILVAEQAADLKITSAKKDVLGVINTGLNNEASIRQDEDDKLLNRIKAEESTREDEIKRLDDRGDRFCCRLKSVEADVEDLKNGEATKYTAGPGIEISDDKVITNTGVLSIDVVDNTLVIDGEEGGKTLSLPTYTGKGPVTVDNDKHTIDVNVGDGLSLDTFTGGKRIKVNVDKTTVDIQNFTPTYGGDLYVKDVKLAMGNRLISNLIPDEATTDNKLVDKNSFETKLAEAIASASGALVPGEFNDPSELPNPNDYNPNDYAIVAETTPEGTAYYRYKVTKEGDVNVWSVEYKLGGTSFSSDQWAAINSTITKEKYEALRDTALNHINNTTLADDGSYVTNPHHVKAKQLDDFTESVADYLRTSEGSNLIQDIIVDVLGSEGVVTPAWVEENFKPLQSEITDTVEENKVVTSISQDEQGVITATKSDVTTLVNYDESTLTLVDGKLTVIGGGGSDVNTSTTIDKNSTDDTVPTSKAVYDYVEDHILYIQDEDPNDGLIWVKPSDTGEKVSIYTSDEVYTKEEVEHAIEDALGGFTPGGITEIPVASSSTLGGIKVGSGLSITADGTLSGASSFADLSGSPTDNANLKNALDAKADKTALDAKADKSDLDTKADKSEIPTIPSFKTINNTAITGSGNFALCTYSSGTSIPSTGSIGQIFVKTDTHVVYIWDGAKWQGMNLYQ